MLRKGVYLQLKTERTSEIFKQFLELPLRDWSRIGLCVDDRTAADLLDRGSMLRYPGAWHHEIDALQKTRLPRPSDRGPPLFHADERIRVGDQLLNPCSDLGEGLLPADRLPAPGVSRSHSFQRMLDPEGIVERLDSGLAFEAQSAELCESLFRRGPVGDPVRVVVFIHVAVVRVIGVSIQFDQYPFLDLGTDAAP